MGIQFQFSMESTFVCLFSLFQIFLGNWDHNTVVKNVFPQAIKAKYVRFNPISWHTMGYICMRVEVYECMCWSAILNRILGRLYWTTTTRLTTRTIFEFQTSDVSILFLCRESRSWIEMGIWHNSMEPANYNWKVVLDRLDLALVALW